ncbi:hypothetical protein FE257_010932 [Aspergillus nanangensis]|uniref:Uncharacterized protein n=1 Tax=Aspergillus nanangensis TaxID=2582783 RepID=A0AAD4GYC4_ASPNN|nr:hypothetical protein FE257_010932 [Aspergillus nanangensis]
MRYVTALSFLVLGLAPFSLAAPAMKSTQSHGMENRRSLLPYLRRDDDDDRNDRDRDGGIFGEPAISKREPHPPMPPFLGGDDDDDLDGDMGIFGESALRKRDPRPPMPPFFWGDDEDDRDDRNDRNDNRRMSNEAGMVRRQFPWPIPADGDDEERTEF